MAESKECVAAKQRGNDAYKAKDYAAAIEHYTTAIAAAPESDAAALCLCNRSICHGVLKAWPESAADAQRCVDIKPDWVKGYQRLGLALRKQGKHFESVQALEKGVAKNPNSADLKKALADAKDKLAKSLSGGNRGSASAMDARSAARYQGSIDQMQKDFAMLQRRQRSLGSKISETRFNIERADNEGKKARLVLRDMENIDKSANVMVGVGKCFIGTSLDRAKRSIDSEIADSTAEALKLNKRKKGLEAQYADTVAQLKEMARLVRPSA